AISAMNLDDHSAQYSARSNLVGRSKRSPVTAAPSTRETLYAAIPREVRVTRYQSPPLLTIPRGSTVLVLLASLREPRYVSRTRNFWRQASHRAERKGTDSAGRNQAGASKWRSWGASSRRPASSLRRPEPARVARP